MGGMIRPVTTDASGPTAAVDQEDHPPAQVAIRGAGPADAVVLKVMLKKSLEEVRDGQFSRINEAKARAYIEMCIQDGACFVAELDGAIIGTICLRTLQEIWSDDAFLNEEWFYVLPRFRETGAALKLLDTAEKLADQMELPVYMAINNGDPEPLERVLDQRMGYRRTGANYLRHPRNGQQKVDHDNDP